MLTCPHNYQAAGSLVVDRCSDNLSVGVFPLPRCISDLVDGIQTTQAQQFDNVFINGFKSKRKSSHMMSYWADFISFDIAYSQITGEVLNDAILIPIDDNDYLSVNTQQYTQINQSTLPFVRSYNISSRGTTNLATAYVDGSSVYGLNETKLNELRDPNDRCKMLLIYGESGDSALGYPAKDASGNYIYGLIPARGSHVFLDWIFTVFLREHNRRCGYLRSLNLGFDDDRYFQEARKWVIALIQKINYLEYLSILMGIPLPEFTEYNPNLVAGVDYTFISTTMRYGHSEISDKFNIVDQNGEQITSLTLFQIGIPGLLESFGVPNIASSLALQRQEEIDTFYSDYTRAIRKETNPPTPVSDLASIDHLRGRDQGVPLYNDVRELYGFSRATDFSDITQNTVIQERLKRLYSSVDKIETLVGGLAEDHLNNSNFGPLFQQMMREQWTLLRDSDRFWFESPDAGFSRDEINEIRNTTWRDVILRNSPENAKIPNNVWFVQPRDDLTTSKPSVDNENVDADGYPENNSLEISTIYSIKWKTDESFLFLKMRILSNNAWFGIGFNPEDDGMLGASFIIAYTENDDIHVGNYNSNGYQLPVPEDDVYVEKLSVNISSGFSEVQLKNPLRTKDTDPIKNDTISVVFAWNPNSNALSYHGGNRGKAKINFFQSGISTSGTSRQALLYHGIWMFVTWSVLFPISIFIVRYMKHNKHHIAQHRSLQVIGGVGVASFGAAALAIRNEQKRTPHRVIGMIIYTAIFVQLGLGLLTNWARSSLESSNSGIFKLIKLAHFILGVLLMAVAMTNVYFGIQSYGAPQTLQYAYLGWIGILVIAIIAMEYWYSFRNRIRCFNDPEPDVRNMIRKCIPKSRLDSLQPISWFELNQRIVQGAKLVVAEDFVFDIRRWLSVHPGGSRILDRVIGTDITNDFYGTDHDNWKELSKIEIPKQNKKLSKFGFVNFVDSLNFNKVPIHKHSRFAADTLATMVVGMIEEEDKDFLPKVQKTSSTSTNPQMFKRYMLIKRQSVVGEDSKCPVLKLTFTVSNQNEDLPKFYPGDYLEIMSHTKGQVVVRPYTALQEPNSKEFSIIVKIYNDGLMSKHLERQWHGFEIKVRGPFNINERLGLPIPLSRKLAINNVLLNPDSEDGCWDILFLICGGTGITPMIQLIEYHLENLSDGRNTQIFMLFANKRIPDIICPKILDELVSKSDGKLNIEYILSEPPETKWPQLHGHLNYDIIFTWLSKYYTPNELKTHDGDKITAAPILISPIIEDSPSSTSKEFSILNMFNMKSSKASNIGYKKKDPKVPPSPKSKVFVQTTYIQALVNDPVALKLMVCGPPSMTKTVNESLDKLDFPQEKLIIIN